MTDVNLFFCLEASFLLGLPYLLYSSASLVAPSALLLAKDLDSLVCFIFWFEYIRL